MLKLLVHAFHLTVRSFARQFQSADSGNCDNLPPKDALAAFLIAFYPLYSLYSLLSELLFTVNLVARCVPLPFSSFIFIWKKCENREKIGDRKEDRTCRMQLTKMTSVSLEMISLEIPNEGI